jgi:uncharacterized protein YodC (DUF2158 family)
VTQAFTEGQVVRLRSGGPWMTVAQVKQDDSVTCQWFASMDATGPSLAVFSAGMLELVEKTS